MTDTQRKTPEANLHPAVQGMLSGLPQTAEEKWTEEEIDEWLHAFGLVLTLFHISKTYRHPSSKEEKL